MASKLGMSVYAASAIRQPCGSFTSLSVSVFEYFPSKLRATF
jgi:hypothetical protein